MNPDLAVVPAAKSALSLEETPDQILIKGDGFTVPFDKSTGLIHNATSCGKVVIEKGPFLNLDLNVNHNTGPEVREKAKNYIVDDADWKKDRWYTAGIPRERSSWIYPAPIRVLA